MKKLLPLILFFLFSNFSFGQLTNFTLQVTVVDETCSGNGVLNFTVANTTPGASIVYSIYRLPDVTTPIAVTAANSFTGLVSGNYRVVATQSLGTLSNSQQQDVTIVNHIAPFQYNLTSQNVLCGNDGKIFVNVTQGTAVNYEIIGGPMTFPLQTSNVFSGLTVGTYQVRVFDSCGDGIVEDITIARPSIPNINISGFVTGDITCTTIDVQIGISSGTANNLNVIAYPINVECTVFPPSGSPIVVNQSFANGDLLTQVLDVQLPFFYDQSYSFNIKITDSCGNVFQQNSNVVNLHLGLNINETMEGCNKKLLVNPFNFVAPYTVNFLSAPAGFNPATFNAIHPGPFNETAEYFNSAIPYPEGNYSVQITDACGRTITQSYTTQQIPLDFVVTESLEDCMKKMVLQSSSSAAFTVEFLSAPAGFNPLFFNTAHPGPFNSFAEYFNASTAYPEGTYVIKITDVCGRTVTKTYNTIPIGNSTLSQFVLPGCELGEGSVLMSINEFYQSVSIVAAPAAFGQTLPYDVSQNIKTDANYFSMNSLPAGTYTFRAIDTCNRTRTDVVTITGYQTYENEVTVTEHCSSFDVELNFDSNSFSNNLWLQKFNPITNNWMHPQTGFSDGLTPGVSNAMLLTNHANNVNLNFSGRFRVVNTFSVFGNGDEPNRECQNVIREFEYTSGPKIRNIYSYSCSNNQFDVIVDATGAAPLQYRITTKDGQPFVINNANSSLFTGLQTGVYNFQIEDACGNILNRVYDISTPVSFSISSANLCNGQTGSLQVPYFSFLTYEWWKDNNSGTILSTSNVLTFANFNLATHSGTYHVRVTNPGNPNSCMNIILDFTISNELNNPEAGTGNSVVLCGTQSVIDLFTLLTGTYDNFGTWEEISSSGMLINHTWNASGIASGVYNFKYRVNGLCGFFDEAFVQIEIHPIPLSPVANGDNVVCEGETLHLFASDIPGVTYQWEGPNGFISNDQNPVIDNISVANQGTYSVKAIQNGCESVMDSVEVLVETLPYFSVKNNCQDGLTFLSAEIIAIGIDLESIEYSWTFPDGTVQSTNPINVTGNTTGVYTLTVTNTNGCFYTDTIEVTCTYCGIPKGVSPNGDGLNDNFDLSCLSGITNVKIFNRYGMSIFEKDGYVDDWTGRDYKGNLLPTATYYYVVKFDSGDVKTGWVYLNYE
jgi:gliding motility-associated-like protein